MRNFTYFGNSAYCYSNSTAMLLASIGEKIAPSLIEVVGGVGLGAEAIPGTNVTFFSGFSGLPDKAISRALKTLGFSFKEKAQDDPDNPPYKEIREILATSPVVFGPLDMSYLVYNPDRPSFPGVDHFVLVYGMTDKEAFLHDPAGFPNVSISLDNLTLAWRAEAIGYKEGYYRYWASPKRISSPTPEEIYRQSLENFQWIYQTGEKYAQIKNIIIDDEAILLMANNIEKKLLKPADIGLLTGFVFPLGARRTSDFADFFESHHPALAAIKIKQSKLLGQCQVAAVAQNWPTVVGYLKELAELEKEFKTTLLEIKYP